MKYVVLFLVVIMQSCMWFEKAGMPTIAWTNVKVPDGTPVFQRGFKDGCSSSTYARGNIFYAMRYGYRYDPKLIGNPEYRFGHQRGYHFCFLYFVMPMSGPNASFDRYILPFGNDNSMSAGDINDAWGGFFDGLSAPISPTPKNGFDAMFDVWSGGGGGGVFSANPIWAGNSRGQFFGQ